MDMKVIPTDREEVKLHIQDFYTWLTARGITAALFMYWAGEGDDKVNFIQAVTGATGRDEIVRAFDAALKFAKNPPALVSSEQRSTVSN